MWWGRCSSLPYAACCCPQAELKEADRAVNERQRRERAEREQDEVRWEQAQAGPY